MKRNSYRPGQRPAPAGYEGMYVIYKTQFFRTRSETCSGYGLWDSYRPGRRPAPAMTHNNSGRATS